MNLHSHIETNDRGRTREGKLSHTGATSVDQRPRRRLWPARAIWAAACVVAMLGWTSALAWVCWKMLDWLAVFG